MHILTMYSLCTHHVLTMYSLCTRYVLATYRFALLTHFETAHSMDNSDIPCNSGVWLVA